MASCCVSASPAGLPADELDVALVPQAEGKADLYNVMGTTTEKYTFWYLNSEEGVTNTAFEGEQGAGSENVFIEEVKF